MFLQNLLDELLNGNGAVITNANMTQLNNIALELYNKPELNLEEVSGLKKILMICNILYNRSDLVVMPIEDGFYDQLLEKYKTYDQYFQVGSAVVNLAGMKAKEFEQSNQEAPICPISFVKPVERNEVRQEMYDWITRRGENLIDIRDFYINPIEFTRDYITKRTHTTQHNHPELVGTLDKAKFILTEEARAAGVLDNDNVKILERDFFGEHIKEGIITPNRRFGCVVELKYDGISVEADCGLQVESARTRGDTGAGKAADISPILAGYTFKHAQCMIGQEPLGVKFEAIMTKSNLARFNSTRDRSYSNCRTAIIGLFGASDAYKYRDLITLIPLALDRSQMPSISNRIEEIEFLNRVFISNGEPLRYACIYGNVSEILYQIKAFWEEAKYARDYLDFMYDGIVVSYLDEDIRQALGRKNYINKYSMAVKFDPIQKQTVFLGYTFEVGQNGQITPMIHYNPVEFVGTIHTKSSGASYERFMNLGLRVGDIITVTYVNDVMPYVSKYECEHNDNNAMFAPLAEFTHTCPICNGPVVISDSGKMALCTNMECPGRSVKRMSNMLQKMGLKGFSEASVIALGANHLYELYQIPLDVYMSKLGNVNGKTLFDLLHCFTNKVVSVNDYMMLGSLGFTGIAHKKWQAILQKVTIKSIHNHWIRLSPTNEFAQWVMKIVGVSETTQTIINEYPFFAPDIDFVVNNMNIKDSKNVVNVSLGQIRVTGFRNEQLMQLLSNAGYDADESSSISKKTDILLVPFEGYESTKTRKAPSQCKIVPIQTFLSNPEMYLSNAPESLISQIRSI